MRQRERYAGADRSEFFEIEGTHQKRFSRYVRNHNEPRLARKELREQTLPVDLSSADSPASPSTEGAIFSKVFFDSPLNAARRKEEGERLAEKGDRIDMGQS